MNIDPNITKEIINLCKKHKVKELYLFGSFTTEKFTEESDIDLLVEFEDIDVLEYFDNFMDLKEKLEKLLERKIDLVENQAIRNPVFRRSIDRSKQMIYG
jgi:predicted nucleotidyltransferase